MSKQTTTFSLTPMAVDFFTEYGDGNRSKGAERAAADLADKPRFETLQDELAAIAAREWEWVLGVDDNERIKAAHEDPARVIAAIEGRPKSAYLKKSLAATKIIAETHDTAMRIVWLPMFEAAVDPNPVMQFALPETLNPPAYLLAEFEAEHGPVPRVTLTPICRDNEEPFLDDTDEDGQPLSPDAPSDPLAD